MSLLLPSPIYQRVLQIMLWLAPVVLFAWIVNGNIVVFGTVSLRCNVDSCDAQLQRNFASREKELIVGTKKGTKERYRMLTVNPFLFETQLLRSMKKATVRLVYSGGTAGNHLVLGLSSPGSRASYYEFADSTMLISALEGGWNSIRNGELVLFQRRDTQTQQFSSVNDFIQNVPDKKKIGTYNIDLDSTTQMSGYAPATSPLTMNVGTHGSQSLIVYVGKDENLDMRFTMQNSNQREGKDNVTFVVSRGGNVMEQAVLRDTGDGKGDGTASAPVEFPVLIRTPGEGTYKIDIKTTSDDPIVRSIASKQKYVMWQKKIPLAGSKTFPASSDLGTEPLTLYMKGTKLTASTAQVDALQTITVGNKQITLKKTKTPVMIRLSGGNDFIPVTVQHRDVVLETDGFFALSKQTSFAPPRFPATELVPSSDPKDYDYVVARYAAVQHDGNWLVAEKTIDNKTLGRTIRFSVSSNPPIGSGGEALRLKELEIRLQGRPVSFRDIVKGMKKLFTQGKV